MNGVAFQPDEDFARHLDETDPLRSYRDRFFIPRRPDGRPVIYFCGHSLGLQPRTVRAAIEQELDDWATLGVEGHFRGRRPWYNYHEQFREPLARLVGALPEEVVLMNSLTVNLHLMLASFYHPKPARHMISIDAPTFPSDLYAVQTVLHIHGYDSAHGLLPLRPRPGERPLRTEDMEAFLEQRGREIAVCVFNGVNFFTGQWLDLPQLVAAARRQGCVVGLDLAHAVGNVPLQLHEWDVDFAVWCSYKYLNSGPGAVAGCFVHERHGRNLDMPRLAGWWGNDPATRFQMPGKFVPRPGAEGWQLSNPPILALAPVGASLQIFDEAGMPALRAKSEKLTGYLQYLLDRLPAGRFEVITPQEPDRRGCQLSILVRDRPRDLLKLLEADGIVCDFREPNVIRVAPVPLYNSFQEVWSFAQALA